MTPTTRGVAGAVRIPKDRSEAVGITAASESAVDFTMIMNRMAYFAFADFARSSASLARSSGVASSPKSSTSPTGRISIS